MLDMFVAEHRNELIRRCRARVELRSFATPSSVDLEVGVPRFLEQLIGALRHEPSVEGDIDISAAVHGRDLHLQGFTISQVVHHYGDVCQSITDLALERQAPIPVEDFRILNKCLDDAIASALTAFGRGTEALVAAESAREVERLGFLTHELRNLVGTAAMAFHVLKSGNVGIGGSTGGVLDRSLTALCALIDRSVDDVRVRHGIRTLTRFALDEFIAELASAAHLEAAARGLTFRVDGGDAAAWLHADRAVLAAAVANLLQNAFKFTRAGSTVILRPATTTDRVLIAVEDECDGLPDGKIDALFRPFEHGGPDRTGLGLGLAMCRWGAEVNGGHVSARNQPGRGCVFTMDLPRG